MVEINLYARLGLDENATKEQIRKAYQRLAAINHPDKGGNEAIFKKVKEAYELLSNEEIKAFYDETGSIMNTAERDNAQTLLSSLILELVESEFNGDYLVKANEVIRESQANEFSDIGRIEKKTAQLQKSIKKIIKKTHGENFLTAAISKQIDSLQSNKLTSERSIRIYEIMRHELKSFMFVPEENRLESVMPSNNKNNGHFGDAMHYNNPFKQWNL